MYNFRFNIPSAYNHGVGNSSFLCSLKSSTEISLMRQVPISVGTLLGNTRLEKTRRFLEGRVLARNYSKRKIANSTRSYSTSNHRVMPEFTRVLSTLFLVCRYVVTFIKSYTLETFTFLEANSSQNRGVPLFFPTDSHP